MECRGCTGELGTEGKNGLCLGCLEDLDRWAYLRSQELEALAEAEDNALEKG